MMRRNRFFGLLFGLWVVTVAQSFLSEARIITSDDYGRLLRENQRIERLVEKLCYPHLPAQNLPNVRSELPLFVSAQPSRSGYALAASYIGVKTAVDGFLDVLENSYLTDPIAGIKTLDVEDHKIPKEVTFLLDCPRFSFVSDSALATVEMPKFDSDREDTVARFKDMFIFTNEILTEYEKKFQPPKYEPILSPSPLSEEESPQFSRWDVSPVPVSD